MITRSWNIKTIFQAIGLNTIITRSWNITFYIIPGLMTKHNNHALLKIN
jgi:hypothetical protein